MPTRKRTPKDVAALRATQGLRLAANPNYFGAAPDSGFEVVVPLAATTTWEELTSVGYNPRNRTAYATFDVKNSAGYGGGLCAFGEDEHVRFYAEQGGGWVDLGVTATDVHDIALGTDCRGHSDHPLSYTVQIPWAPQRHWCLWPQLRRIRAILSYGVPPPPNQPNWVPTFGNVRECPVQIDKTYWLTDLFTEAQFAEKIDPAILEVITPHLPPPPVPDPLGIPEVAQVPEPPEPGPAPGPLSLEKRLQEYTAGSGRRAKLTVDPARIALPEIHALAAAPDLTGAQQAQLAATLEGWKIDLGDLVGTIEKTSGNTDFEELVDLGLDYRRHRLDATYVIKRGSGYGGGLCTSGTPEYVAFWADWDDTCEWTHLGTVEVRAYDFGTLPDGRLCYTASLPVDLSEVMERCTSPKIGNVRAVLSWSTPPSTTDPDAVGYYGNRLDAHVLVPILQGTPGTLTIVGGVATDFIGNATGMTAPGARFALSGALVDSAGRNCPFGGLVVVQGPPVAGKRYRLRVVDSTGASQTLTEKVWVTPTVGSGSYHTGTADGWFDYLPLAQNFEGVLGYYRSSGDGIVDIILEVEGEGDTDHQVIQLDNTWPTASIDLTVPGNCEVAHRHTDIEGVVTVDDTYIGSWRVEIDGGPVGFGPYTVATGTTNVSGAAWTTNGAPGFPSTLQPCGYVARVVATDRAVVNSGAHHHHFSTDVGFSVV